MFGIKLNRLLIGAVMASLWSTQGFGQSVGEMHINYPQDAPSGYRSCVGARQGASNSISITYHYYNKCDWPLNALIAVGRPGSYQYNSMIDRVRVFQPGEAMAQHTQGTFSMAMYILACDIGKRPRIVNRREAQFVCE